MSSFYFYQPKLGHQLKHNPFKAIIAPRPIGWISTRSVDGVENLAPYSFFNAFADEPPIIGFSSAGWKDSVANIEQTKEFCWNLTTRELAEKMNLSCAPIARERSEFELAGLTSVPSNVIDAPRVGETPVSFECRLTQLIQLKQADQTPMDNWLVLGEVVGVHIDERLLEDGIYQTEKAHPVMRAGGPASYFGISTDQEFELYRPKPGEY